MSEHEHVLKDPGVWQTRARGQIYVANILSNVFLDDQRRRSSAPSDRITEDVALFGSLAYHYGIALELAAKGAIATRTAAPPPLNHDLVQLCQSAGVQFTPDERDLAERLTEAIKWWGRYAAPKKAAHLAAARPRSLPRLSWPADRKMLWGLLHRLGLADSLDLRGD